MEAEVQRAKGLSKGIEMEADARRKALEQMANILSTNPGGSAAASFTTAEHFVEAFGNLAKETNTVIVPSNPSDVSGMVRLDLCLKISKKDKETLTESFSEQKSFRYLNYKNEWVI